MQKKQKIYFNQVILNGSNMFYATVKNTNCDSVTILQHFHHNTHVLKHIKTPVLFQAFLYQNKL